MSSGNIVKLDVGGTQFKTSKSTLTRFDGFFKTMLETDIPLEKDETGTIFIDRSPKHFELILNYMRDGLVNIPDSKSDVQEIQIETQYYLLDALVKECGEKMSTFEKGKVTHARTAQELALALTYSESKALIMIPLKTDGSAEDVIRATVPTAKIGNKFDVVYYDYDKSKNPSVKIRMPNTGDIQDSKKRVKLDVGGTIFETSKSALTKLDGFFKTMLETDIPLETDEHGAIFTDRSPKHFELILNYMRDGFVNISDSKSDIQEIQIEGQYYLLDDIVELCKAKIPEELPVKLPIINHFLNTIGEVINALLNSTKKAAILIPFEEDSAYDTFGAVVKTNKLLKYVADFDVYFVSTDTLDLPKCRISDTSTANASFVHWVELEEFMKDNYGDE